MDEKQRENNRLNLLKFEYLQLLSDYKLCLHFVKLTICNDNYVWATMQKTSNEAAAEHCLRLLGENA